MYKALIKTQLLLHLSLFLPRKKNKKVGMTKSVGVVSLVLYIGALIAFGVGFLLNYLGALMLDSQVPWIYFAVVGIMYVMIGFFGSIYSSKNFMFDSKDNEMLLSMPITSRALLICRVMVLLLINFAYSLLVSVPCLYIFSKFRPLDAAFVIRYFLCWVLLVLLSVTLTCLFGLIIGYITSKMRRKYLAGTVVTVFLMFGVYFVISYFKNHGTRLLADTTNISAMVKKIVPPLYYFSLTCYYGSGSAMSKLLLWSLLPFSIVFFSLSAVYFKILTTNKGTKRTPYKGRYAFYGTLKLALIKKELKRIFTVTVYIMNCTVGMVMHLIVIVALLINANAIIKFLLAVEFIKNFFPVVIVFFLCLSTTSACTTSCSISMEGDNFWILKSLPAGAGSVIFSKIAANMVITLPTMLAVQTMICRSYAFKQNEVIYIYAIPVLSQLCVAMIGMLMNLLLPKLVWNNPTMPVKQSASVTLSLIGATVLNVLPVVLYFLVFKEKMDAGMLLAFTLVYFVFSFLILTVALETIGRTRYNRLAC